MPSAANLCTISHHVGTLSKDVASVTLYTIPTASTLVIASGMSGSSRYNFSCMSRLITSCALKEQVSAGVVAIRPGEAGLGGMEVERRALLDWAKMRSVSAMTCLF